MSCFLAFDNVVVWLSGGALDSISVDNPRRRRRTRLVIGWVTVRGFKSRSHHHSI